MSIELITPYKESVLTRSLINTKEVQSVNAALLSEIRAGDQLSTRAQTYTVCVIRRLEYANVRNMIIEEEYKKLKAVVTKRKVIQSGKRKVINGKYVLITPEVYDDLDAGHTELGHCPNHVAGI